MESDANIQQLNQEKRIVLQVHHDYVQNITHSRKS